MAIEVEVKAWVENPDSLKDLLEKQHTFEKEYLKDDIYFLPPGAEILEKAESFYFRLRTENGEHIITRKEKTVTDGIEVNQEQEFTVSDSSQFEDLMYKLGCSVLVRKKKKGWKYSSKTSILELSHVDNLGYFIEIEKIIEDEKDISRAREEVKELLEGLGVSEDKIESRSYTSLLLERK